MSTRSPFVHRITGETSRSAPAADLPGLWIYQQGTSASQVVMPPAFQQRWACPDTGVQVYAVSEGDPFTRDDVMSARSPVAPFMQLSGLPEETASWQTLLQTSPIDSRLAEGLRLSELEASLAVLEGHERTSLEIVCETPREQLDLEPLRLPVHRIRRPTPNAAADLMRHPEDADLRPDGRVIPKRLQGMVPRDLLDLYENRLTTKLVELLERHLADRLESLSAIEWPDDEDKIDHAYYRALRRYTLLLSARVTSSLDEMRERARETANALRETLEFLEGVRRLRLFQRHGDHIPVNLQAEVHPLRLHTNLFGYHAHYRQVGLLWDRYWEESYRGDEIEDLRGALWAGFFTYCRLLMAHALANLGFHPDPHEENRFTGARGEITITSTSRNTLRLSWAEDEPALELVPLPLHLDEAVRARLAAVGARKDFWCVLGLPTVGKSATTPEITEEQEAPFLPGSPPWCHAMVVSPTRYWSTERLARLIQNWLCHTVWNAYPPRVQIPFVVPREWTVAPTGRQLKVLSASPGKEDKAEAGRVLEYFRRLRVCPVCATANARFMPRDHDAFSCTCPKEDCRSTWGLNLTHRQERYAFILPGKLRNVPGPGPHWMTRVIGRDAVAMLCMGKGQPAISAPPDENPSQPAPPGSSAPSASGWSRRRSRASRRWIVPPSGRSPPGSQARAGRSPARSCAAAATERTPSRPDRSRRNRRGPSGTPAT